MSRPSKSILDRSFRYTPSTATSVEETWRRHGWRPLREQRRAAPVVDMLDPSTMTVVRRRREQA